MFSGVMPRYSCHITTPSIFRPASGAAPAFLAGRSAHIEAVEAALAAGHTSDRQPIVFDGRVLTGRTAVLNEAADASRRAGWATVVVAAGRADDMCDLVAHGCAEQAGISVSGRELRHVVDALDRLAAERGCALFIDDIDHAATGAIDLMTAVTKLMTEDRRLIVVATSLPNWPRLLAANGADPTVTTYPTGLLETQDIVAAVIVPARASGVNFTPDAVEAIVKLCHGVPALVQMLAHHALAVAADNTVTKADVVKSLNDAEQDVVQTFFAPYHAGLAPGQHRFLRALRQEGDGATFEAVRSRLGDFSRLGPSPLRGMCDALIESGVLYSDDGKHLNFSVAAYGVFVATTD
jgi:hypothetical protein